MKIPLINSDAKIEKAVQAAIGSLDAEMGTNGQSEEFAAVPLHQSQEAIEYINYQTPQLIMINFSDAGVDGFDIMGQIIADPWLNHGGILAFYGENETLEKINELKQTNIIISLPASEIDAQLLKVLGVIQQNQQILFQRAIQSDFLSNISAKFLLDSDTMIIALYSNLVANYLYNMGFVDMQAKFNVGLSLTEMLTNAIEHGNCGISNQEKTEHLEKFGTILGLIAEKIKNPEIARRKVIFQYEIHSTHSTFFIADEGEGFDWREYVDDSREPDLLSLHGRGILLTRHSVGGIEYNDKGNEVTLQIPHRRNATNTVPLVFKDDDTLEVQPDQIVFRSGEESDFLYFVAEGEYRVEVEGKKIATITPADILMGEMAFLLQEKRSATVVANTPGKLVKISKESFINSLKKQPYYGLWLARLLAHRLYNSSHNIIN